MITHSTKKTKQSAVEVGVGGDREESLDKIGKRGVANIRGSSCNREVRTPLPTMYKYLAKPAEYHLYIKKH